MKRSSLVLLLILTGQNVAYSKTKNELQNSTQQDKSADTCRDFFVLKKLELLTVNPKYTLGLPVTKTKRPILVDIKLIPEAILDVRESDQIFITQLYIQVEWRNELIKWSPADFCGIGELVVPSEYVWNPFITIKGVKDKDQRTLSSPFLKIKNDGKTEFKTSQVFETSCKMRAKTFPFDTQICCLTFLSDFYDQKDLNLRSVYGHKTYIEKIQKKITQYEWSFENMTVHHWKESGRLIFTITMHRRYMLYVTNFLLPIIFFLCLDLASFLMPDGGEKIGFQITVLLAVTVMQLLLNDILPRSSEKLPLIVVFCIVIFALMLTNLLETIMVMSLMSLDSVSKQKHQQLGNSDVSSKEVLVDEMPPTTLNEGNFQELSLNKLSGDLREIKKSVSLQSVQDEDEDGYWTRLAKTINKIFRVFYIFTIFLFLAVIFSSWLWADDITINQDVIKNICLSSNNEPE